MTLYMKLAAAGVVIPLIFGSYAFVYKKGRKDERQAMLARSVEVLRERNKINDNVEALTDNQLCISLGGLSDNNGKCL
jgi:hypothetical protein